ncbi:MAG TPA: dolichyl-phosphate beta-glucosyltransferase [Pyrinomonadaceae bacterium]|nr:dolichyl-phosphate beta-glucosyltransferase [Pyrinomonadaceae bacterium]
MSPSLSVIVPAYNEAARLGKTLPIIFEYLKAHYPDAEVIVVDDGSTDETCSVIEQSFAQPHGLDTILVPTPVNRGKGHAVRSGLLAARGQIALFSDADLSTPITELPKLVQPIESGSRDLTFGSRALDRQLIGVHQHWRRELGGRVFNSIVRVATGLPFWDTQCGFKAFRMRSCRSIVEGATIDRFAFDVELLYLAHKAGLRLEEIAVRWDHNEGSKVSFARDSKRMLTEVSLIRRQMREGIYDEAIKHAGQQLQLTNC